MIYYLRGTLKHKSPEFIIVEVGGVGHKVNLSLSTYESLPPEGRDIKIYTYLHLREDKLTLYGFLKEEERKFFLLLISLSNIGPKSALRILSRTSPLELKRAIREEDLSTLTSIPGIGRKTAQRLILELKEKIGEEMEIKPGEGEMVKDTISALVNLGYTRLEARKAVEKAFKLCGSEIDLAKLIRESLRHI